jgi:hypothetical protein
MNAQPHTRTTSVSVKQILRVTALAVLLCLSLLPTGLATADTGTVTVTGTSQDAFTFSFSGTAAYGTGMTPKADAASGSNVTAYNDQPNGAYYVAHSSASSYAVVVTVSSTKAWSGSVAAATNTGTSGMTIAGGALRWKLGDITSLAEASSATAFSSTADTSVWNTASSCSSGATLSAGVCTYNYDIALRVRWIDTPGTFSSVVTYTATQAA